MYRIIGVGFALSIFMGEGYSNFSNVEVMHVSQTHKENIDPIITGVSISQEHLRVWKINNDKYRECGLCGEELQAYPGD